MTVELPPDAGCPEWLQTRNFMNGSPRAVQPICRPDLPTTVQLRISGPNPADRLTHQLEIGKTVRIGRAGGDGVLQIYWDLAISREHADLRWDGGRVKITCVPAARNPVVHLSETKREAIVSPGESFQLGATIFHVVPPTSQPVVETETRSSSNSESSQSLRSYASVDLQQVSFENAVQQLEVLSQLPARISASQTDSELGQSICDLLMDAIPHASAVAVAQYDLKKVKESQESGTQFPQPETMRVRTRDDCLAIFRPSRSIVTKVLESQQSILHIWEPQEDAATYTVSEGLDWALCSPICGSSSEGWCMYVSGKGSRRGGLYVSEDELLADVRFTELVSQFISSMRHVQALQEQKTKLNSFFSPKVIDSLNAAGGHDILAPAERNITVLFCDVRGFSKKSERQQHELLSLLESVRAALSVMVDGILDRDGAIADFQGDAAMGFWGWPVALKYGPIPACRAAIAIHNEFRKRSAEPGNQLAGFSVGIGIAHGNAIAGQIGTKQQSKIGVFGPVVNQCSRLESMTKQFGVSICIDSATADFVDRYFAATDGRLRRLAKVRPKGMEDSIEVYNLLPSENDLPEVSDAMITAQESACSDVAAGRWKEARQTLAGFTCDDGPKDFLLRHMESYNNVPPANWDGVFELEHK